VTHCIGRTAQVKLKTARRKRLKSRDWLECEDRPQLTTKTSLCTEQSQKIQSQTKPKFLSKQFPSTDHVARARLYVYKNNRRKIATAAAAAGRKHEELAGSESASDQTDVRICGQGRTTAMALRCGAPWNGRMNAKLLTVSQPLCYADSQRGVSPSVSNLSPSCSAQQHQQQFHWEHHPVQTDRHQLFLPPLPRRRL